MKMGRHARPSAPQATAEIFAAALRYSQAGRLDEVVTCFRKAVRIAPDFALAHYNLGNALGEQGRLDEAIVCFHKAIELAPGLAEAHSNLGAALKQRGGGGGQGGLLWGRESCRTPPPGPGAKFKF